MAKFAPSKNLLRVSRARKTDIDLWKEGRFHERESNHTLEELFERATADRFRLALDFCRTGDRHMRIKPPLFRAAVGRYYYAMYHGMRAVAFLVYGGDDFEDHKTLPSKAPDDFPNQDHWKNALKDARERRNQADYNAYPKSDASWRQPALALKKEARAFLAEVNTYLRAKGCRYL